MTENTQKSSLVEKILKNINQRLLAGIVIGGLLGYASYHFVGCSSGTCAITSSPINSTMFGMFFGGAMMWGEKPEKQNSPKNEVNE